MQMEETASEQEAEGNEKILDDVKSKNLANT